MCGVGWFVFRYIYVWGWMVLIYLLIMQFHLIYYTKKGEAIHIYFSLFVELYWRH